MLNVGCLIPPPQPLTRIPYEQGCEGGGKNPEKECLHLPLSFVKG